MEKTTKPIRRKGVFSFFNKQKVLRNLLKTFVTSYHPQFHIVAEDSSHSAISGDMHFRLQERPHKIHSLRTVDLFYKASSHEVKLTFSKTVLPKVLANSNFINQTQTIGGCGLYTQSIQSMITTWFKKEEVPGYKVNVVFITEFPLFNYKRTLYVDKIGMSLAKEIVADIFEKEVSKNSDFEIERFCKAFRTSRHMFDCTLHCSVISLASDKEVDHSSNAMTLEIGNQIYAKLMPAKKPDTVESRKVEYFKTLVWLFTNWWRRNTIQGRVQ